MSGAVASYIRIQGVGTAVANAVINPALAWLGNRAMEPVALWGVSGVVLDTTITSFVLTLVVTFIAASCVRRELASGGLGTSDDLVDAGPVPAMLPADPWPLGLTIGAGAAVVLVSLAVGSFHALGLSDIPFRAFAVVKAVYTGVLGYLVMRWVVLRRLAAAEPARTA